MIGKLIDARLDQELLERRAANLLHRGHLEAEKAAREEKAAGLMDLGLDAPSSRRSAKRSKAPSRGAGWNRGMRMWTPSVSERSRRVEGLLHYITTPEAQAPTGRDRIEKCIYWNSANFRLGSTVDDHIDEMAAVASMVTRGGDPIAHIIFSLLPGEQPTPAQVDEAVRIFLMEAKFEGCRTVWALHDDRDHAHIHVVVCRVDAITRRMRRWDGDSGWSHDVLGRTVARIDALQGWTSAKGARFVMEGDRVVPARRVKAERAYSQSARRQEIESGGESAERRARAAAAGIDLDRISSWQEFHRAMAVAGLCFELHGRGLVVHVGAERIKASQVGRVFSLGRLENRFGAFENGSPALDEIAPPLKQQQIVPDEIASMQNNVDALRTRIVSRRRDLRSAQAAERKALEERHRRERDDAYGPREGRSFKGEGAELNRLRAEIAQRQHTEIAELTARHRKAREEQASSIGRAPSLPGLLTGLSRADDANRVRHFLGDRMIEISPSTTSPVVDRQSEKRFRPLRPFSIAVESAGVAEWCRGDFDDPSSEYFEDYGRRLLLLQTADQEALLAALTLAHHRGGPVNIDVAADLRRGIEGPIVCLAAAHGISLADSRLEGRRKGLASEWEARNLLALPVQTMFDEMHAGVQADSYAITTRRVGHESGRGVAWSRDMLGLDAVPPHVVRACLAEIAESRDRVPYLTPRSADRHFVSIDGMDFEHINERSLLGARWSTILTGEDGRLVVVASAPADPTRHHDQLLARSRLTTRLNGRHDGDTCSIPLDPARFGIGRDRDSRTCPLLTHEFNNELARVEQERARDVERRLSAIPQMKVSADVLYTEEVKVAARHLAIYAAHATQIIRGVSRPLDGAVVDSLVVKRLQGCGLTRDEISAIISSGSPRISKEPVDAKKYLTRMLKAASSVSEIEQRRARRWARIWQGITDQAVADVSARFVRTENQSVMGRAPTPSGASNSDAIVVRQPAPPVRRPETALIQPTPPQPSPVMEPRTSHPLLQTSRGPIATTGRTLGDAQPTPVDSPPAPPVPSPAIPTSRVVEDGASTSVGPRERAAHIYKEESSAEPGRSGTRSDKAGRALKMLSGASKWDDLLGPPDPASGRSTTPGRDAAAQAITRLESIIERDLRDLGKLRGLMSKKKDLPISEESAHSAIIVEINEFYEGRLGELGPDRRETGLSTRMSVEPAYEFIWKDAENVSSGNRLPRGETSVAGIYSALGETLLATDREGRCYRGTDARAQMAREDQVFHVFTVSWADIVAHAKGLDEPAKFVDLFERALIETSRLRVEIRAEKDDREMTRRLADAKDGRPSSSPRLQGKSPGKPGKAGRGIGE